MSHCLHNEPGSLNSRNMITHYRPSHERPGNFKRKTSLIVTRGFFTHYTSAPNLYSSPWLVQAIESSTSVPLKEFKECVQ